MTIRHSSLAAPARRRRFPALAATFVALALLLAGPLAAATSEEMEARVQALEERLRALEAELAALKAGQPPAAPAPAQAAPPATVTPGADAGVPAAPLPVYGSASALAKILNPDVGVIGNFIAATGHNRVNPFPSLSLQESEVSLQAVVDPYARADFFLAIGEEGIEVEEGYITFPALPGGFSLKAGRMRVAFGRQNQWHNHSLPWVDRPLMTFNLLGGIPEEADVGIKDAGISISRLLPAPGNLFLEGTAEVYRGDSGALFQAHGRNDVAVVGHLRSYADLTEQTNVEVGTSYARGSNEFGSGFHTHLYGLDATLRWKPLRRAIYRGFVWRTELVWSRRREPLDSQQAFGWFTAADYRLGRRWFLGGRYDWSERGFEANTHDSGGSLLLTYWPSEFSGLRGQLRRTRYAENSTANEFLFQLLFTLGAHGAHPF